MLRPSWKESWKGLVTEGLNAASLPPTTTLGITLDFTTLTTIPILNSAFTLAAAPNGEVDHVRGRVSEGEGGHPALSSILHGHLPRVRLVDHQRH